MRPLSEIITEYDAVVGQLPQPEMHELISRVARKWHLLEKGMSSVEAKQEAYEQGILVAKVWLDMTDGPQNHEMGGASEYEEIIKAQELMEQSNGHSF